MAAIYRPSERRKYLTPASRSSVSSPVMSGASSASASCSSSLSASAKRTSSDTVFFSGAEDVFGLTNLVVEVVDWPFSMATAKTGATWNPIRTDRMTARSLNHTLYSLILPSKNSAKAYANIEFPLLHSNLSSHNSEPPSRPFLLYGTNFVKAVQTQISLLV